MVPHRYFALERLSRGESFQRPHTPQSPRTLAIVKALRGRESYAVIAKRFGVSRARVGQIAVRNSIRRKRRRK
jgi:hypothetical protein